MTNPKNNIHTVFCSERTEPTHTSFSSPISTHTSISTHFSLTASYPQPTQEQQLTSSIMPEIYYPPTENVHHFHLINNNNNNNNNINNNNNSLSPSDQTTTSQSITSTRSQQSPTHHTHHSHSGSIAKADPPHPHTSPIDNQSAHTHHQHAISLLKRKKFKNHIANRQRDLDMANRQINKRIEKEKRDQVSLLISLYFNQSS
jgi:hypothetical protein